jgi:glyoxylase I family protein
MQFAHIALNCVNMPAAIEFYTRHFGFQVTRRLPIGGDLEIVFIGRKDIHLELFPTDKPAPTTEADGVPNTGTLRHFAFQVDNVADFLAAMGSDAVVTLGPLDFGSFIPGWHTVLLRDPNGHIIEVTQNYSDADPVVS